MGQLAMCVLLVVYFLKDTEPSPLQDSSSVRQQGGLPGPPLRSPPSRIHRRPGVLPLTAQHYCPVVCVTVSVMNCRVGITRPWSRLLTVRLTFE
jgi:hypothetical protein